MYNILYNNPLILESSSYVEGNEDAFLALGEIDVYDDNLKSIITVKTEDFVKVVTDAMFKISNEYNFFYSYLKYSKVFYVPTYPSAMGINTMAVDDKKNLWMNVHFIYNSCKMDKDRVFGILFHELMHNFFKHGEREWKIFPKDSIPKNIHMKCNICQDFEVNASMVDDGVVPENFWKKMNGMYKKEYAGMRWEDILKNYGDKEYNEWMENKGIKLSEKTKEALKAIEEALKILRYPDSTDAEKERAKEILKRKMDELYGKKDRTIVDKADLSGLRRELDNLLNSQLSDIDDVMVALQNLADDLKTHPKDMDDHDIEITISDIRSMKREITKYADKIADMFRKDSEEVIEDVKKSVKSLAEALNVLHDGDKSIKIERRIIRQAKDDLEGIILSSVDKKRRKEKREEAIEKHKEELKKKKEEMLDKKEEMSKKDEELKKKNPIKKFVDTFKNLKELIKIDRISEDTYLIFDKAIDDINKLTDKNISDIELSDVNGIIDLIPELKESVGKDLKKLKKRKILKMSDSEIETFINDIFNDLEQFFKILLDDKEPSSVKFGHMSLAVEGLRQLGKKLKTKKIIKASKEWKKAYKETREKLIKIYKEKGKDAVKDEIEKMGGIK